MLAPAAAQTCSQTVGMTYVDALDSGLYNFQMNEYDSSLQECVTISGIGFGGLRQCHQRRAGNLHLHLPWMPLEHLHDFQLLPD